MAPRQSDLFSVNNGDLLSYMPIRIHDRGRKDPVTNQWVKTDTIIVMMMSDILLVPIWEKGVKIGYRKRFMKPMNYIPCAGYPDAPRMSAEGDKAFSGTFVKADVDGESMTVLMARDRNSNPHERWVLVREGWQPHLSGKYLPSVVDDIKKGKRIGNPGSFRLGASAALASTSSEAVDEEAVGGRVTGSGKSDFHIEGQILHFALYSLCNNESIIGQTRNGVMWQMFNKEGEIRPASESEAEGMRPLYDFKEKERREQAKHDRITRLRAQKERERAERLKAQEAKAAGPAPMPEAAAEVMDDQVVSPASVEAQQVAAD